MDPTPKCLSSSKIRDPETGYKIFPNALNGIPGKTIKDKFDKITPEMPGVQEPVEWNFKEITSQIHSWTSKQV